MLGKLRGLTPPKAAPNAPKAAGAAPGGLAAALARGITLQPERIAQLKEGFTKGLEFFEALNDSRLKLAFRSFDEDMKKAQKNKNLELAKQAIDILVLLQEKTKGNLSENESKLFDHLLYDLRMKYVEVSK